MLLDARGVHCSTGSACSAGVAEPSHVLLAMGATEAEARSSLRFSLGPHLDRGRRRRAGRRDRARGRARARSARVGAGGALTGRMRAGPRGALRWRRLRGRCGSRTDAGHDVTGVHLALSSNPQTFRSGARGCCSLEDSRDARRVADVLGIPYYVWDLAEQFRADVVDDFVAEYAAGRTPNPCLRCNERIKFAAVLDRAVALGFDAVCTGHYARVGRGCPMAPSCTAPSTQPRTSPTSWRCSSSEQLDRSLFPLGDSLEVRGATGGGGAGAAGRRQAGQPRHLLHRRRRHPGLPGRAARGATRGHPRRATATCSASTTVPTPSPSASVAGSGSTVATPDRSPRYVLSIEPTTQTVVVGSRQALAIDQIVARPVRWCGPELPDPADVSVQFRAHGEALPATVSRQGDGVRALLATAGRGGGAWTDARALRRHAGPRVGGHRRDGMTAGRGGVRRVPTAVATGIGSVPGEAAQGGCARGWWTPCPSSRTCPSCRPGVPGRRSPGARPGCSSTCPLELELERWRTASAPGRDVRRSRSLLAEDLDAFEEVLQGFTGPVKVQVVRTGDAGGDRRAAGWRRADERPGRTAGRRGLLGRRGRPAPGRPGQAAPRGRDRAAAGRARRCPPPRRGRSPGRAVGGSTRRCRARWPPPR